MLVASGSGLFWLCDQHFYGNGKVVYGVLALKIMWIKKEELETLTGGLSDENGLSQFVLPAARFGVEAVKHAFMASFCAYDIGGK